MVNCELDEIQSIFEGVNATMMRRYFDTGHTDITLSKSAQEVLRAAAYNAKAIRVRGSSDNVGSYTANIHIARMRASAARRLLVSLGVPPSKIDMNTVAMEEYIASNKTADDRARNRRVEVVFISANAAVVRQ